MAAAQTAESVTEGVDLSGKFALVTGVNSGIGTETARVLALRGATVLGTARTQEKAAAAWILDRSPHHQPLPLFSSTAMPRLSSNSAITFSARFSRA